MHQFHFTLTGLACAALLCCGCRSTQPAPDGQQLFVGDDIAVAQTTAGKVRGFILRDIYQFKGIPYGAPTSGKNRFMPPQEPEKWSGVRPTMNYGESAPQTIGYDRSVESMSFFQDHWNYDLIGEDCLKLNVWTPGLDGKKRPVLVWLHGGGFSSGNAIEQDGYGGENLARYGDIVFCSVNHRLNAFGFSDFAAVGGEKYKHSGNVGMLDIVAALKWVRDNISRFGGDPDNVTVIGQSGGGAKVCLLASMPEARGLVHKAVALSGNTTAAARKEQAEALGAFILQEAGLRPDQIDKLQEMPWEEYYTLAHNAAHKFRHQANGGRIDFSPVGDGIDIPAGTLFDPADATLPDIPMLLCTTLQEWNPNRDNPELENISLDSVVECVAPLYGEKSRAVVEAYARTFPQYRPVEIWAMLLWPRTAVVQTADLKSAQAAPVYMAWFQWQPPLFDGRQRAFHCIDICFWLHNTDVMLTHTGGGARPRRLSDRMSDALLAFMRTGNPNCPALPDWPAYTPERGDVMVLDDGCSVQPDPDRACRTLITN